MDNTRPSTATRTASRATVVAAAIEEIDALPYGGGDVTLAAIAKRVGIAAPSLYKHVSSSADLHRGVATECVRELREQLTDAVLGRSGPDAVRALMFRMREFARQHPGRYAATQRAADLADPDDAELAAESDRLIRVIAACLADYAFAEEKMIDAIRVVRSAAHGFIVLELGGGFGLPHSVDRTFDTLVEMIVRAVDGLRAPEGRSEGARS